MTTPLEQTIKDSGLKLTSPRQTILAFLQTVSRPVSAGRVFRAVEHRGINRSSVFRSLKTFDDRNIVLTTRSSDGELLYELRPKRHHHHLHCSRCGRVESIGCFLPQQTLRNLERRSGFRSIRHAGDLYGTCPDCLAS